MEVPEYNLAGLTSAQRADSSVVTSNSISSVHRIPSQSMITTTDEEFAAKHKIESLKCVILAGGPKDGTRFRPLSEKTPKPLFPVAGTELLYHQLEAVARVEGMKEIMVIGLFEESSMASFIKRASGELRVPIRYLREYQPLGTAGGLHFFRDLILLGEPDAVIVMHADICAEFELSRVVAFHSSVGDGSHMTVLASRALKEDTPNFGCLRISSDTHIVTDYVEKPKSYASADGRTADVNAGIYVLSPAVWDALRKIFVDKHTRVSTEGGMDTMFLERDVMMPLAGSGRLFGLQCRGFWSQVKSASLAIYANRYYLSTYARDNDSRLMARDSDGTATSPCIIGNVFIDSSATVDATAKIGPNVSIGPAVRVGPGTRIKETIILGGASIGRNSCIMNSVIDSHARIGDWVRVEGASIQGNPNAASTVVPTRPLFARNGTLEPAVTIIGESSNVADETLVRNVICMPLKDISFDVRNQILL